jgi:hypothetical protein
VFILLFHTIKHNGTESIKKMCVRIDTDFTLKDNIQLQDWLTSLLGITLQ